MDPFNRRSSAFSRKPVQRRSLRLYGDDGDDEDSYDLAAATVADGFRPTGEPPADGSSSSSANNPATVSPASSQARLLSQSPSHEHTPTSPAPSAPTAGTPARPSSAIKPPRPHDSLTLRSDGSDSLQTGPPLPSAPASSETAPQIRPQSPYLGPTGPSHPYQMYPQRTLSNATSSTDRPADRGPAHPYALYPQNIVANGDETPHRIPVGFTTSGDAYQRQIGPDGEEAGALLGPLGHTEELPPYSRYPDQPFVAKTPAAAAADAVTATTTAAAANTTTASAAAAAAALEENVANTPAEAVTGAGGIGVATRNPEFSSTEEDLWPSRSRPSTHSHHDINTAAQGNAEKPPMNKWQRRAKKKLWGIVPYWAICLLLIGVILIGVILGAVIGTVLSRHKAPPHSPSPPPPDDGYSPPRPTASDVVPLSQVPISLPRLPFGLYELPSLIASQSSKTCFNESSQTAAWSCNMPFSYYEMDIFPSNNPSDTEFYNLTLKPINMYDAQFLWGTQPPNVFSETLLLVNDTLEPRRGPAWWLKVTYDKKVVVAEESLSPQTKRWDNLGGTVGDYDAIRVKAPSIGAKNGDKPWICTWPHTTLEIFIYPVQNTSSSPDPTSNSKPTPSPTTSSSAPDPYPTDGLNPYPNTVKFLERQASDDAPEPFCRQVLITDGGRSMQNLTDSYGNPIIIQIDENSNSDQGKSVLRRGRRLLRRGGGVFSVALETYELTPCGCLWLGP
ncbi:hypothetical protein Trco_002143 [Trichoderma cornu-damae]|uniref:DUF7820 domain-containing protein n=1 Tax=Trichoderma cornu-damae TaxID=654480 RepID=A0A9P8TY65_9HYPO|nr:hypothetical protein Trco_002143 [Trichoderma cornu-damae]